MATFFWGVSTNNQLVTLNESTNSAWAQVQNQYQRRLDLIPNLVETVRGYAKHEKGTLEAVIQARSQATKVTLSDKMLQDPAAFRKFERVQGELSSALSRLLVVTENYPNLKANEGFLQLQSQLEGTENRIAVERKRFNEVVQEYNVKIKVFPSSFIAGLRGFAAKVYFEADEAAKQAPKVNFN